VVELGPQEKGFWLLRKKWEPSHCFQTPSEFPVCLLLCLGWLPAALETVSTL